MNTQQAADAVAEFLRANGPSTKLAITEATSVKGLALTNALKKLTKDNFLQEEGEGDETLYSEKTIVNAEGQLIEEETTSTPAKKGRNNQKFKFNGEEYGKGRLVLAVVRQYVEDHKPTLKQLKEAFPDELLQRYGVVQELDKGREMSARDRYFFKEEDQIKVKGKVIVVSNQWTSANLVPFTLHATKVLGFKIR